MRFSLTFDVFKVYLSCLCPANEFWRRVYTLEPNTRLVGIGEGIEITLQSIAKAEVVEGYGGKPTVTISDYLSPRIDVLGKYCGL